MVVKAKRLGWDELLSAEDEMDHDPYDHGSDDLSGELVEFTVPKTGEHPEIRVCLVGGQEADPNTLEKLDA